MKPLQIGDLVADKPIIQGGMGIGVSLSGLAGAVAAEGGIGILSSAQIGYMEENFSANPQKANLEALAKHLKTAKSKNKGGAIGVNIMAAIRDYEDHVRCCVEQKADIIISGAGLPVKLPELVQNSRTKIAPIVSSVKALAVLLKTWDKRYEKTADAVVVEGPKAGGHLGFKPEQIQAYQTTLDFDHELAEILRFTQTYEEKYQKQIPVIFGGGVYDKNDILHYLHMGCSGVQMATRFVVTEECDAHENFKNAYINATENDIQIVKSPVGLPGRAIRNPFIEKVEQSKLPPKRCYQCLQHCQPAETPYCITAALINAVKGRLDNALLFCGETAGRVREITTVRKLMSELV